MRSEATTKPFNGRIALLADDDELFRRYVAFVLRRMGFLVIASSDGPGALEKAWRFTGRIDLLVTSLKLPCIAGVDLAEQVRAQSQQIKVLFLVEPTFGRFQGVGGEPGIVAKPFLPAVLSQKVEELFKTPSGSADLP